MENAQEEEFKALGMDLEFLLPPQPQVAGGAEGEPLLEGDSSRPASAGSTRGRPGRRLSRRLLNAPAL